MKYFVSALLVVCIVIAVAGAASANQGTWKSYATDSLGMLSTTDSQSAYVTSSRTGAETKVNNLEWTIVTSDSKSRDYSTTTTDGSAAVWNINDNDGNYQQTYITPSSFDTSRGIVMAKIKINSQTNGSINGTFGVSTSSGGLQLALRGSAVRIKDGMGGGSYASPADFDQIRYRVYAISWIGTTANVWYSNTTDWSATQSDWTSLGSFALGTGNGVSGIVLTGWSSGCYQNANYEWFAHNTYDDINGQMTPWSFNPAIQPTPEPGSLLALGSGLFGLAGFAIRRRRA
jgi:hypothetical protein